MSVIFFAGSVALAYLGVRNSGKLEEVLASNATTDVKRTSKKGKAKKIKEPCLEEVLARALGRRAALFWP